MNEKHYYEELENIIKNAPLFIGDTISRESARECVKRGWADINDDGDFIATPSGILHNLANKLKIQEHHQRHA